MQNSSLLHQLLIALVVLTSTGTLVQDTKLGRAVELTSPLSDISVSITSHLDGLNEAASAHTHVQQVATTQELSGLPRMQARDDHKKYMLPKYSSRSNTQLGDGQIIWPSV